MASLLVNRNREIVHRTEPATQYLHYPSGEPTHDVLEVMPKAIRAELREALRRAFQEGESTGPTIIETTNDDDPAPLTLRVRPLYDSEDREELAQVLLTPTSPTSPLATTPAEDATQEYVERLEAELRRTKEQLQNTIEEYETTTEELESANEELLSMNEELQAQNEEIETKKEEIQSVNAELKTTNQELKTKVGDLNRANTRLRNLMQETNVATLFLDRDLRIEWFTPRVREHFNIREIDTGRPLSDFTMRFHYDDLLADARDVLDTLQSMDREIQDEEGRWFLVRLRPYRTLDDEIEGLAITFVDITDRKTAEMKVREERNFVNRLLDTVGALVVVLDTDYRIVRFNEKCESVTGYCADEVEGESVFDRLVPEAEAEAVRALFEEMEAKGGPKRHEHHWISRQGSPCLIRWSNTTLTDEDGTVKYLVGTGLDITLRRQLEREVIAVSDRERQRIGQDLHDILASHLTGTALIAQEIARRIGDGEDVQAAEVREISDLIKDASEQARKLSHSLMPLEIQEDNLASGLENLAREEEKTADVTCTFEARGSIPALDQDVAAHLYRIASEAVSNAIKHGNPDRVDLRLEAEGDVLSLVVRDDGRGLSPDTVSASSALGLNLMRYRSDLVGAHLEIESEEKGGTVVHCSMPVEQGASHTLAIRNASP